MPPTFSVIMSKTLTSKQYFFIFKVGTITFTLLGCFRDGKQRLQNTWQGAWRIVRVRSMAAILTGSGSPGVSPGEGDVDPRTGNGTREPSWTHLWQVLEQPIMTWYQEAILHGVLTFPRLSVQACLNSNQPWKLGMIKLRDACSLEMFQDNSKERLVTTFQVKKKSAHALSLSFWGWEVISSLF